MAKVSVVVPNYNHARFLKQRMESIFAQIYQDFEVILLDDYSTDDSRTVIEAYRAHPKVAKIIYNERNSGSPFKQWNKGVAEATGEYVWIAESDDVARPELLETLTSLLEADACTGLAYAQSEQIDENGVVSAPSYQWTDDVSQTRWRSDYRGDGRKECALALAIKNTIPNASAVVFRKAVFEQIGGAEEGMRLCGDWMTWVKMLGVSDIAFHAAPLNAHRGHSSSVTRNSAGGQTLEETARVRRAAFAIGQPGADVRAKVQDTALEEIRRISGHMGYAFGVRQLRSVVRMYSFLGAGFAISSLWVYVKGRTTACYGRLRMLAGRWKSRLIDARAACIG
jgi:hypothetical protein